MRTPSTSRVRRRVALSLTLAVALAACDTAPEVGDADADTAPTGGTLDAVASGGASDAVATGGTTDTAPTAGASDAVATGGTTDTTPTEGASDSVATGGTTDATASGGTSDALASGGTTDATASGGTSDALASGGSIDATASGGTSDALASGGSIDAGPPVGGSPDAVAPPANGGPALGPVESDSPPLYRVEVRAAGDSVEVVAVTLIAPPERRPPPFVWDGPAWSIEVTAAGERLELQPIRLPAFTLLERLEGDPATPPETVSAEGSIVTLLMGARPDVDRIALLDPAGAVVTEVQGDDVPRPVDAEQNLDLFHLRYPHIRLNTEFDRLTIGEQGVTERLVDITPEMADALADALDLASPRIRLAIRQISVSHYTLTNYDDLLGATHANNVTLSDRLFDDWSGKLATTTIHEGAHSLVFQFIRTQYPLDEPPPPSEIWPEALRPDIEALIDRFHVEHGGNDQIKQFQDAAHDAEPPLTNIRHGGDDRNMEDINADRALEGGFPTPYATTSPEEDLAEVTAFVSAEPDHPFCQRIRAAGEVDESIVLPWAKIRFAQGAGYITDEAVAACVGETTVRAAPGLDLGPLGVFDGANDDQVRIASGFTAFFPPEGAMCGGRINISQIFFCGLFDGSDDEEREYTVYARGRYGPFGWGGEGVPAGYMPGDPLPAYKLFELAFYLAPERRLVGVHRLTRWGEEVIGPSAGGGGIRPYGQALWQDSSLDPPQAGSLSGGLAVFTHADADFVEGILLFARFGDLQTGQRTHVVPLAKMRITPNLLRDPCCGP